MTKQKEEEFTPKRLEKVLSLLKELKGISKDEALAQIPNLMVDDRYLYYFTLLVAGEDDDIALTKIIAEDFELDWLDRWITIKLKLRTSVGGWRSKQYTTMVTEGKKSERQWLGFFKKLFRRESREEKTELEERSLG